MCTVYKYTHIYILNEELAIGLTIYIIFINLYQMILGGSHTSSSTAFSFSFHFIFFSFLFNGAHTNPGHVRDC